MQLSHVCNCLDEPVMGQPSPRVPGEIEQSVDAVPDQPSAESPGEEEKSIDLDMSSLD
jgi:hypothetical protein